MRVVLEFNDPRSSATPMRTTCDMDPVPRKNETIEVGGVLYMVVNVRHVVDNVGRRGDARHSSVNVTCRTYYQDDVLRGGT